MFLDFLHMDEYGFVTGIFETFENNIFSRKGEATCIATSYDSQMIHELCVHGIEFEYLGNYRAYGFTEEQVQNIYKSLGIGYPLLCGQFRRVK